MTLLLVVATFALVLYSRSVRSQIPVSRVLDGPVDLLVVAPHQDDGVIIAGGLAARNGALGGEVAIVYLTNYDRPEVRNQEAIDAWSLGGIPRDSLTFLQHDELGLQSREGLMQVGKEIQRTVDEVKPEVVVVPLAERGHVDHDLANTILKDYVNLPSGTLLLQGTEYNPFLSIEHNPELVLNFAARLLPFAPYGTVNLGLFARNQTILEMSEEELALKRRMLLAFESQRGVIPLSQFGYPDRFEDSSTQPACITRLFRKCFSIGSVVYFLLLSSVVVLCGVLLVIRWNVRVELTILALGCIAYAWTAHPFFAKEELVLVSLAGGGASIGQLCRCLDAHAS